MQITRLRLAALSPAFPGPIDLDFAALGAGLLALVGANGEGKTTLLESSGPGPIFRKMPSGDGADPVSYAVTRQAGITLDFVLADERWRARLALDGPKRASNAVLERVMGDGEGVPHNDGKVSTYDAVIKDLFPSYDLFLNSAFAGQGRGDEFTRRKPSQRKDLFAEFLGQQHYARMATVAAEAEDRCHDSVLRLGAVVEVLETQTGAAAVAALDEAAHRLQVEGGEAEIRKQQLLHRIAELEAQQATAGDAAQAYRSAQARCDSLTALLGTAQRDTAALADDYARTVHQHDHDVRRVTQARDEAVTKAEASIAKNQAVLGQAEAIRAAVAAVATTQAALTTIRARLAEEQAAADATVQADAVAARQEQAAQTAKADLARAERALTVLQTVPFGDKCAEAGCQFVADATAAKAHLADYAATAAPLDTLTALRTRHRALYEQQKATWTATQREIAELDAALAQYRTLTAYEAPLAAAEARIAELTDVITQAQAAAAAQVADLDARLAQYKVTHAAKVQAAAAAEARVHAELVDAQALVDQLAAGNETALVLLGQIKMARVEWDITVAVLGRVEGARATLAANRTALAASRTRLLAVREQLRRAEDERLEWADLRTAFAKGGLPDLEIDAAGPTISATTNAILHACFGPRFTVELVTQVEGASGQMKDEFTVRVVDNAAAVPEWRDIKRFSGGQKTILQEALMLAICLYVNERSPRPMRTLWRDETGAALDVDNAVHYVAMLRQAQRMGGFHQVLFVTHSAAAAALADVQLQVHGGAVDVVFPPFASAA